MTKKPDESKRALVNNLCPNLKYNYFEIESLILVLDQDGSFHPPAGELSIAFVSKDEIARLHGAYMDDPTPTDVLTFPGDPETGQAGEICICPEVASDYARQATLNFSSELALYIIHGYLHLCGFDDVEEHERAAMRKAEQQALKIAKAKETLPNFSLKEK